MVRFKTLCIYDNNVIHHIHSFDLHHSDEEETESDPEDYVESIQQQSRIHSEGIKAPIQHIWKLPIKTNQNKCVLESFMDCLGLKSLRYINHVHILYGDLKNNDGQNCYNMLVINEYYECVIGLS